MTRTQIKVMLIEDNPADVLLLKESLSSDPLSDFHITVAELLKQGLAKLAEENFDVLLLDLGLPDSQGLETFETAHAKFFNIPIIVLSGTTDDLIALKAVQAGAQDYLVKGAAGWSLGGRAIRYAVERHQAQLAKSASEARFSTFFHSSPVPTAITRLKDGIVIETNSAWCQYTGYSLEEVVGCSIETLDLWVSLEKRKEVMELMRRNGTVQEFEAQVKRRTGEITDALFSAELIEVAGEPCILSMAQDITERKRAEQTIRESEERFHNLFNSMEEGLAINEAVLDENGDVVDYIILNVNPAFEKHTIYKTKEVLGKQATDVYQMSTEYIRGWWKEHAQIQGVAHTEMYHEPSKRWFHITTTPPKGKRFATIFTDITKRRLAEEQLRESEERYRIVSGLISDYAYSFRIEPGGRTVYEWVTDGFIRINGYTLEEVTQRGGTITLVHPDDLEIAKKHIQTLLQNKADTGEFRIVNKDGSIHWLRNYAQPMRDDASGRVIRIYGSTQDITERRQAEELLRQSEQNFRELLEHASDGIFIANPQGYYVLVNQAACDLVGYSREELYSMHLRELVAPENLQNQPLRLDELRAGKTIIVERTFLRKDGTPIQCELSAKMLPDGRFQSLVRDITARKQNEKALHESEERFHKAFRSSPVGMSITASDGSYLDANEAFSEIVGFSHEELVSHTSLQLNITAAEQRREYMQRVREKGSILNQEISLRHKSGKIRTVLGSMEIIELNGMAYVLSTAIDITESKLAEEKNRQQSEQLRVLYEASQRLNRSLHLEEIYQSVCDFMSTIASMDGMFISAFDHETLLINCRAYWVGNKWLDVSPFPSIPLEEEGRGTQSKVIRSGQSMLVNDYQALLKTTQNVHYVNGETNEIIDEIPDGEEVTRSALIVPLKSNDVVTGVIQVESYRKDAYTEDQLKLLEALALHIASAEQNALLYAQVQAELNERKRAEHILKMQTDDLALINSLNEAANRGESIAGLVKLLTKSIEDMTPAYRSASVYLFDPSKKNLELQTLNLSLPLAKKIEKLIGQPIPRLEIPIRDNSYFQKILDTEQGAITSDPQALQEWIAEFTETIFLPSLVRARLKKFIPQIFSLLKIKSVITVPLVSSGIVMGLMDVSSEETLTEDDLTRLRNISRQITAVILRKQSEQSLFESENKYRALVENMKVGMVVHNPDTSILLSNPMASQLLGLTQDQMLGKMAIDPDWCFIHENGTRAPLNEYPVNQALSSTTPISNLILGIVQPDRNDPTWVQCSAYQVYELDGRLQQIIVTFFDITERKQAEDALKVSTEFASNLIASMQDGISVLDKNGVHLDVNAAFCRITGFSREELIGAGMPHPYWPLEEYGPIQEAFEHTRTNEVNSFELTFKRKNDERFSVIVSPFAIKDNSGNIVSYSATVKDITERKQAEEVLRKSEDRFRSLFENAPVGVLLVDPQGNVLEVNPSALQILGSPSAEATRQINMLNFPSLIDAGITADFQKCVQTVQFLSSEHPYTTKWGKSINLNLRFAPLVDTEGDLQLLQILIEDVSARKEAEQALEESQSRFRALFEDSPIAIWEEDFSQVKKHVDSLKQNGVSDFRAHFASHPDEIMKCAMMFNILNVNSAALRMYQAANKEDLIQNTIPVLSVGELEHIHEDLLAIAEGRTSNGWDGGDDTLTGKPIQISLTWSVVPGYEHDYSKVVVTTVDITERKQAEELIRQYTDELELRVEERTVELVQANRAKDEFLANMSHELRTPLNGILGFSETLLEGVRGPLNERQGQALEIIQSSGQHLLGLINDILDVAKIESGKFELQLETLVVNDICNSSLNFIKQMAVKKSISVEYSSRPASSTLIADPKRLKQILVNLLNNAVKFTPEKGRVKLDVLADAETGLMRFSVTDTGIGIAPEDQRKLFQPFVQVDSSLSRQYEGTGLGLMLVKKLVEMHNGSVEMKSEPGNGSCFTFTLPWSEEVQQKHTQSLTDDKEKSMAPGLGSAKRTHTKILLAEDNEANVTAIMDYLEFHGYEVTVAHDGREVFSKAEKMLPDIVLMDIQMPNVNGFEATRRLRSDPRFATVPIIALTAFAMSGDRERCLAAGMNEYLSKPVKLKELQQMIERFLENPLG